MRELNHEYLCIYLTQRIQALRREKGVRLAGGLSLIHICPVKIYFRRMGRQHDFRSDHAALFGVVADFSIVCLLYTSGWVAYKSPKRYKKYGSQKGWERVNQAPPEGDGFQEITEEEARQMELPF